MNALRASLPLDAADASGTVDCREASRSLPDLDAARRLLPKYTGAGPRYTSYPTAPVWSDRFDARAYESALARSGAGPLSLYVHVPYCEKLCTYCACNRTITRDHSVVGPYLDALELEADRIARALGRTRSRAQLALGGGTPTFLTPSELDCLARIIETRFPASAGAEASIEIDPRVTTREQLAVLAEHGFRRISLGVQDLSPRVQQAIRRIQSRAETERSAAWARELGFDSVHFDLIYGLPFQTLASFDDTLRQVIEMRPDRLAVYSYAHVTWVSKQQRGFEKQDLPAPELKLELFMLALQRLTAAGYEYLGLDHFALPDDGLARAAAEGRLRRNFMGYTTQPADDLVALGPSGIGELTDSYAQSVRTPQEWSQLLASRKLPVLRGWSLSAEDLRRKWLIQRLMCQGEVSDSAYEARFGESLSNDLPELGAKLAPFVKDGILEGLALELRVTPLGRLFLRNVAMLFDAYLEAGNPERPRFSSTV